MYVCLCNGISDKSIRAVIRQHQPSSLKELQRFVPVGTQCGKCLRSARQILEHEQGSMVIYLRSA
ncbi:MULTISPECIES: bacterioferritin-associated ferredoxin [Tatumella]|uniref:Bacterioferritin-associated ferredoxin n=2 Tax=Tatumella ptyseos TaxID=82987 RepID=A0A085JPM5_9GAMM|nr:MULTISPECIES: bacterioferritin-associated ferredoxin [Tatumella]KFD22421.1 bacterioferritin-associated ferredoxin [Tatumella ptyseos ATCC 33301]SQK71734.1 Bacterioferritin-associated ferredoxin [Tatumella ptyseos]